MSQFKVGDRCMLKYPGYVPVRPVHIIKMSSTMHCTVEFETMIEGWPGHGGDVPGRVAGYWFCGSGCLTLAVPLTPFEASVQDYISSELHK